MVQAWVAKKHVHVTFYEILQFLFFALGCRFHENCDILEAVNYNVKLLHKLPHISIPVHLLCPWLPTNMSYPY
jgi:hypothetical protein